MKHFKSLKESLEEERIKDVYDISKYEITRFDLIDMIFKFMYYKRNLTDQDYNNFYNILHELNMKQLYVIAGMSLQEHLKVFKKIEDEFEN